MVYIQSISGTDNSNACHCLQKTMEIWSQVWTTGIFDSNWNGI